MDNQFDCFWKRREKSLPSAFAKEDAKCAHLEAMLKL